MNFFTYPLGGLGSEHRASLNAAPLGPRLQGFGAPCSRTQWWQLGGTEARTPIFWLTTQSLNCLNYYHPLLDIIYTIHIIHPIKVIEIAGTGNWEHATQKLINRASQLTVQPSWDSRVIAVDSSLAIFSRLKMAWEMTHHIQLQPQQHLNSKTLHPSQSAGMSGTEYWHPTHSRDHAGHDRILNALVNFLFFLKKTFFPPDYYYPDIRG